MTGRLKLRHDAGAHRQPHGLRVEREINAVRRAITCMGWATSIVAPPDGAMSDYMRLVGKARAALGNGLTCRATVRRIADAPRFVSYYILHRKAREDSILHRLSKGATDIPTIVRAIYIGIDPRLTGAAGLSVLAHLEDLVARGVVETDGQPAINGSLSLGRLTLFGLSLFVGGAFFSGATVVQARS